MKSFITSVETNSKRKHHNIKNIWSVEKLRTRTGVGIFSTQNKLLAQLFSINLVLNKVFSSQKNRTKNMKIQIIEKLVIDCFI